jgi:hypothetical protein
MRKNVIRKMTGFGSTERNKLKQKMHREGAFF